MNIRYEKEKKSNLLGVFLACGLFAFWVGFCWAFGEYTLSLALGI